jgi:hypothetical protein
MDIIVANVTAFRYRQGKIPVYGIPESARFRVEICQHQSSAFTTATNGQRQIGRVFFNEPASWDDEEQECIGHGQQHGDAK